MSIGGLKEISRILPLEPPCLVWYTGFSVGAWRSPGAHLHGVQGVAGSNPAAPTISAEIGDANDKGSRGHPHYRGGWPLFIAWIRYILPPAIGQIKPGPQNQEVSTILPRGGLSRRRARACSTCSRGNCSETTGFSRPCSTSRATSTTSCRVEARLPRMLHWP